MTSFSSPPTPELSAPVFTRRWLIRAGGAGLAAALAVPAWAQSRQRLPAMTEGPFYPVERPLDDDADLTRVAGQSQGAQGQWLDIGGVVVDQRGRVIDRAEIEIWQCDVHGSYRHPRGASERVDAGFQGFGASLTDAQGAFRFRTIRPVPYPGRTPHIHVKLRHPAFGEITSQWFVGDEPANERDFIYRSLSQAQRAEVLLDLRAAPGGGPLKWQARRDVVVPA